MRIDGLIDTRFDGFVDAMFPVEGPDFFQRAPTGMYCLKSDLVCLRFMRPVGPSYGFDTVVTSGRYDLERFRAQLNGAEVEYHITARTYHEKTSDRHVNSVRITSKRDPAIRFEKTTDFDVMRILGNCRVPG